LDDNVSENREYTMRRIFAFCILCAFLPAAIGCYSTGPIAKDQLVAQAPETEITLFAKDSVRYTFAGENYRIHGDTLSGYGIKTKNLSANAVFDVSVPYAEIDSIEARTFKETRTYALFGGIGLVILLFFTPLFTSHRVL
jgi:hypothetical protein